MIRFYAHIILFCLPILLGIYLFPINKERIFSGLDGDCLSRGSWIYDRLYNNKGPVDLAFIGSSHTINGISEEMIAKKAGCSDLEIVNLGYCRLGRNMTYTLLKELLQSKKPKAIVLEVRSDEDRYSHPIFPFIANKSDVLFATPFFNRDFLTDNANHFAYRCQMIQEQTLNVPIEASSKIGEKHGHSASSDTINQQIAEQLIIKRKQQIHQTRLAREFYLQYPRSYLNKIRQLCHDNNIKMFFLYIPQLGMGLQLPKEVKTYEQYGKLLLPLRSLIEDLDNWHDGNHLNVAGAEKLSTWVGKQLDCNEF